MSVTHRRLEALTLVLVPLFGGFGVACSGSTNDPAESNGDADADADANADGDGDGDVACAEGALTQPIGPALVGCGGAVSYADRATLCAGGSHVCTADEWVAGRGIAVPENHYWTDDGALGFAWSGDPATEEFTCWADTDGSPGVESCEVGEPMHVCAPIDRGDLPQGTEAVVDSFSNGCNWINCGLGSYPATEYFGGCSGNDTAGALCCR